MSSDRETAKRFPKLAGGASKFLEVGREDESALPSNWSDVKVL